MIICRFFWQWFTWTFPADAYVRWGWWMLSIPLLVVIALRAPFYIAREWEGCKPRAIRSVALFAAVFFGADVAYYAQAAYLRAFPKECHVEGPSLYGQYDAVVCVTAGLVQDADTEGFVRLRSTVDGAVLAERSFYNPSFNHVMWGPDYLSVGVADGSAQFQLPPTRWDWLLARLP